LFEFFTVLVHFDIKPLGKCIDHRQTHTVQAARDFVSFAAELAACVQFG
jgi:hypothetical protein